MFVRKTFLSVFVSLCQGYSVNTKWYQWFSSIGRNLPIRRFWMRWSSPWTLSWCSESLIQIFYLLYFMTEDFDFCCWLFEIFFFGFYDSFNRFIFSPRNLIGEIFNASAKLQFEFCRLLFHYLWNSKKSGIQSKWSF